jgi:hypothetical protein
MIVARIVFVSNTSKKQAASAFGIARSRLQLASAVLEFAPELADGVISGGAHLDAAYQIALDRKAALNSSEK